MTVRDAETSTPTVSVLLPTYNTKEEYLREAIESILGQTFTDFELLILDDGSTDANVGRVVRSYDDPRIRFSVNQINSGISKTRNRLIEMARGKYLAIMDHDDVSLPQRFEKEVAYLNTHPKVGVVSSQAATIQETSELLRFENEDLRIRLALMEGCALLHPAAMVRKSVLTANNLQYEDEFSPAEDYALWCRMIPHAQFHNLPEVLFNYRVHATNTCLTQKDKMDKVYFAVRERARATHPDLYGLYLQTATQITRVKLFGFIPFLKFVTQGRRTKCFLFGIPLFRSKHSVKLEK